MGGPPLAYLVTFTCHGTWLHGDERGSVDREHSAVGEAFLRPDPSRKLAERRRMRQPPYHLDERRREIVLRVIQEVCTYRGWSLLAAHVRSNHVHFVVTSADAPERVMNDVKAYASRALNQTGWDPPDCPRWTRHGSTRYLWQEQEVAAAIRYVTDGQGKPMAAYASEPRPLGSGEAVPLPDGRGSDTAP